MLLPACQSSNLAEPTPAPTHTIAPSSTPEPTVTLVPIDTQVPTQAPTPLPEGVERISMKTPNNVELIGFLHQPEVPLDNGLVVVLAHGHTQSHKEWVDFEKILIDNGITTMAFDFSGHGESGGADRLATIGVDVTTVVEFLKQRGYERIICIGSSMGGTACAAGSIEGDIDGLVMLSSPMNRVRLISLRDFQALSIPKIIMFTENDHIAFALEEIDSYYKTAEDAGEPKDVYIYPGVAHGSGLLYEQGDQVITILLDFVKNIAE